MDEKLLRRLGCFFGTSNIFPVGSGTVGLTLALEVAEAAGRDVIIPAFTCPNVVVAVKAAGGNPVVVDVSPTTLSLTSESIKEDFHPNVAAIVAVDAFGYPAPVGDLIDLAEGTDCTVIDDACQAYGGFVDGQPLGARGDIGIISFGYGKPVSVNGGGMLIAPSDSMAARVQNVLENRLSSWASTARNKLALYLMKKESPKWHYLIGSAANLFNYTFPTPKVMELSERWDRFEETLETAKQDLRELKNVLDKFPSIQRVIPKTDSHWLPWRLSAYVDKPSHRDHLQEKFAKVGVGTSTLYKPITHYPWRIGDYSTPDVSDNIHRHIINIRHSSRPEYIKTTIRSLKTLQ